MKTFCTKFPPEGYSLDFPHTNCEPLYELALKETHKSQRNYCNTAICVDAQHSKVSLSSITKSHTVDYSSANAIYIQPTLPAKGPGNITVWFDISSQPGPVRFMWTQGYSEKLYEWMTKLTNQLAELTGLPAVRLKPCYDC